MKRMISCPNGHRWEEPGPKSDSPDEKRICPRCRLPGRISPDEDSLHEDSFEDGSFDDMPPPPKITPAGSTKGNWGSTDHPFGEEAVEDETGKESLSLDEFTKHLTESGLMSAGDVKSFTQSIPEDQQPQAAEELAHEMIRQNVLTNFQASALCRFNPEPVVLGDYVIQARLGAGGMGEVFRAHHRSMNRMVALKVLRPQLVQNKRSLERFKREAYAAAQLEHENIVTVYDVGQAADRYFFTMRLVDGASLAEIIRSGPLENRRAAAYIETVALAVHEAHTHGILHRDLKPQNILIDEKTDRPLVADFGLAKLTDEKNELTRSGEIMGTPCYMSPEQARDAAKVSAATDIYSLGATLYHLLTSRPPFQAATPVATLRQVIDQEAVSPRQLNATIDRDLETICLKCLEKEPSRRYSTSELLAEDIQRYLTGRPLVARPLGVVGRSWRWCRRNPLAATLGISTWLFLLLALVATTIGYFTTSAAHQRAEQGFRESRRVVNEFLTRVSDETLLNQPGMQPLKKDLLLKALHYYQGFLSERGDDPSIRDEVAEITYFVGMITEQIDDPANALDSYRQALKLQTQLVTDNPDALKPAEALGKTYNAMGRSLSRMKQWDESLKAYQAALKVRDQLARQEPNQKDFLRRLANTHMNIALVEKNLGMIHNDRDRFQTAQEQMSKAQKIRTQLLEHHVDDMEILRDTGMGHYNVGNLAWIIQDETAAEKSFIQALTIFEKLYEDNHQDLDNTFRLVVCSRLLGDLHADRNPTNAAVHYAQARGRGELLARQNPEVSSYQAELSSIYIKSGQLELLSNRTEEALASMRQAVQILKGLGEKESQSSNFRYDLALTYLMMADTQLSLGKSQFAREKYSQCLELLQQLVREFPENSEFKALLDETKQALSAVPQASQ